MMLDVIGNIQSKPGGLLSKAQALYFVRIIQQHPVLEIYQLFWGSEKLALLDIGITEGKGIVYIHPARISQPLNFLPGSVYASGCDEKGNTTDALLKEVPAWQPGSWYETCKGKPNQKELEAMLGRPYHFVKPRKGQFTMDNSVEEMKDASSAGAPLRSMLNPHSVIKYRTYTAVSQQKKIHIDLFPAITYYKYRSPHLLGNAERGGEYFL